MLEKRIKVIKYPKKDRFLYELATEEKSPNRLKNDSFLALVSMQD
jgi:hypothetical protein